ncbi:MAG: FtsQ-type POTRA domain-containing protein [Alphaproteobacteria bacterium]|nr:FtsQ-type POTRA domain-containing protein [Alphaproteobacteria bacterium]MDE2012383.1 FtsQ-type POTRA domain-containing protein [Alphaproteobacteria bacterium]MDE2073111.1 FtsQ-type POTRA domain-containing protein [Alphaproteobacteria bacterium]MDE2353192.1 FtsQ-type POTRA domain-containing protein [Alphaproteobacteria bacterium]
MRSVRSKRKPVRAARGKSARREARQASRAPKAAVEAPRQSFGRRAKLRDDIFSRSIRTVRRWFTFRRPMLYFTGALLVLTLIAGLFVGGYVRRGIDAVNGVAETVSADAGFGISSLHLSGESRTPPESVLAALNFRPGQSIFTADLQGARARLMLLPWVKDAVVTRRYPDSISVAIVEKRPFALWQSQNGLFVIQRSGAAITRATLKQFPHLPVFIGGAPTGGGELVDAVATHRAVAARLQAMERVSGRRWNLILDDGVVVKLPETGWQKQLGVLEHLIVDKGVLERDITEIDLRSPDNYFFTLRQETKQKPTRGSAA